MPIPYDKRDLLSPWDPERLRRGLNAFEPYAGAGVEVTAIAEDASELCVRMPLTRGNANLVGTHFGGSLYSMVDPHLMILVMVRLGNGYTVWDRAASIEFLRPGVGTVSATIRVTDEELEAIREATRSAGKHLARWNLEIVDEDDQVVARVEKTVYVRQRRDRTD